MLKRLLEQQEIYIKELERKNREYKEQMTSSQPMQSSVIQPNNPS